MMELTMGDLCLPRQPKPLPLPVAALGELGQRGVLYRDISDGPNNETARGPFRLGARANGVAEYPVLWGHDAKRERQLIVEPDCQGYPKKGCEERAAILWQGHATRLHFNRDFQLNSQPLAACLTKEPSIGGRAWPNFILKNREWEFPVALWANSTLGLMSFWWIGTRQQLGRTCLTISRLPELMSIDVRKLDPA